MDSARDGTDSVGDLLPNSDQTDGLEKERDHLLGSRERRRPSGLTMLAVHKKNLLVLSLAFLFTFTAYNALQNLQSSLHAETGVASLAVIYGGLIVSCLFAPTLIRAIGAKWTLVASMLCYVVYTASNFYPKYYSLVPAGLLLGLAAAPLWIAQGTYLTTTAIHYADEAGTVPENAISQFNGIFFFLFQASQITGNLVASLVLYPQAGPTDGNSSNHSDVCGLEVCGGSGTGGNVTVVTVPRVTTDILISVYLACGLLGAVLLGFLLDKLRTAGPGALGSTRADLVATLRLLKNPLILMLIPLFVYSGIEEAFIFGDFTKAYITCSNGIHFVGFVMMVFGITDAMCSILFGQLEKYVGRMVLFIGGGVAQGVVLAVLLFVPSFNETSHPLWDLFVIAAVWGFGDAVWQTQTASIIGVIFKEDQEPAFSNFRLFQALGFCIYFALSTSAAICVFHKIIVLGSLLILSLLLYLIVEWKLRQVNPL